MKQTNLLGFVSKKRERDEVTEATPPNQPPNTLAAIFSNANFTFAEYSPEYNILCSSAKQELHTLLLNYITGLGEINDAPYLSAVEQLSVDEEKENLLKVAHGYPLRLCSMAAVAVTLHEDVDMQKRVLDELVAIYLSPGYKSGKFNDFVAQILTKNERKTFDIPTLRKGPANGPACLADGCSRVSHARYEVCDDHAAKQNTAEACVVCNFTSDVRNGPTGNGLCKHGLASTTSIYRIISCFLGGMRKDKMKRVNTLKCQDAHYRAKQNARSQSDRDKRGPVINKNAVGSYDRRIDTIAFGDSITRRMHITIDRRTRGHINSCLSAGSKFKREGWDDMFGIVGIDFVTYLKERFRLRYGYDYQTSIVVHVDHIIPSVRFTNKKDAEQLLVMNHFTNFQLLRGSENMSKKDNVPDDFDLKVVVEAGIIRINTIADENLSFSDVILRADELTPAGFEGFTKAK